MKTIFTIFVLALGFLAQGCSSAPKQPTVFHVTSVDSCARPQLVGTIGKMHIGLNRQVDEKTAMSVACPGVGLDLDSIGKDFPAVVDLDHRRVTLTLPVYAKLTFEEYKKGIVRGKQTGTEPVAFEIDRMEEIQ